jgi:hypothetical protein
VSKVLLGHSVCPAMGAMLSSASWTVRNHDAHLPAYSDELHGTKDMTVFIQHIVILSLLAQEACEFVSNHFVDQTVLLLIRSNHNIRLYKSLDD